jgi:hypothetical protein
MPAAVPVGTTATGGLASWKSDADRIERSWADDCDDLASIEYQLSRLGAANDACTPIRYGGAVVTWPLAMLGCESRERRGTEAHEPSGLRSLVDAVGHNRADGGTSRRPGDTGSGCNG